MVSKKGDLFSKEAIVEYLAHHKIQERKEKGEYEDAMADKEVREPTPSIRLPSILRFVFERELSMWP